ncbi:MAG: c-type cytochrome, partial [Bacteroidia bacterium]|nr:c-type cytochrome [Bacteroidia bacterium]
MAKISEKTVLNMSRSTILRRISRSILTLFAITFVFVTTSYADSTATVAAKPAGDAGAIKHGEELFKANCKSCHKIDKDAVGPALRGIKTRRKPEWIHSWVKNNAVFRASGDKDAIAIYEKFNKSEMTAFPTFTNEDIDAIVDYVEWAPVGGFKPPSDSTTVNQPPGGGGGGKYDTVILSLVIVVLILVLVSMLVFLSVIKRYLKDKEDKLSTEDKELVEQKFDIKAFVKSKGFITIVVLAFIMITVRTCWLGALSIGVEQNYQPVQPIHFSHKLHAGDNKINCNYCHTGVYKGKQSNIPSLNICM